MGVFCVPAVGEVITGAPGPVVSTTTSTAAERGPVLSPASVALAVKL